MILGPKDLRLSLAICLALLPGHLWADGGLLGRTVQFNVETWDDPDTPYLGSRDYIATVGPGPEFGMVREGRAGLDVVPVLIDVSRNRIRFRYAQNPPGAFAIATFNGYVLQFLTECTLIRSASIDPKGTTLPMDNKALTITPQSLGINVSGLSYGPEDTITLALDVADCPLS